MQKRSAMVIAGVFALASCSDDKPGSISTPPATPTPAPSPSPSPSPSPTPTPPVNVQLVCETSRANPTSRSPYSDDDFKKALDNSLTLQWPTSTSTCMRTADLQDFTIDPGNFYRDDQGRMVFSFLDGRQSSNASETTRLELRGGNFDASATNKIYEARYELLPIQGRSNSFTFAQVFGDTDGAPIVRVFFDSERDGLFNRIWVAYRRGTGSNNTVITDLGPAPQPGTVASLRIAWNVNGGIELRSSTNNSTMVLDENFAFWTQPGKKTYFKSGCYVQASGSCDVRFASLSFDR